MNATPRSQRLSSTGQVVAILVGAGVVSIATLTAVFILFFTVLVPSLVFGGKEEIPSDMPVYPEAHLNSAIANGFFGCTIVNASWSTPAPSDQVVEFYRSELNTGPWTLTDSSTDQFGDYLYFESASGPHRDGLVSVSTQGGSSYISMQLAKPSSSQSPQTSCRITSRTRG